MAHYRAPTRRRGIARPTMLLLAILLAIVAILFAIDRTNSMKVRPASGSANALSQAATPVP